MKKIILLMVGSLLICLCHAQTIQFKKNIILKDNIPVGKFEGKATLLKGTNVSILSPEGVPLVSIKDPLVVYGSSFHEPLRYYSLTFIPLGKKVAFVPADKKFFTSEKKLIEFIYAKIGQDFLGKNGLDSDVVDRFVNSRNDETKTIHEDTTHIIDLINVSKQKLKDPLISRTIGVSFKLSSYDKEIVSQTWAETFQEFDIIQSDIVIGRLSKRYKGDPGVETNSSVPPSQSVKYIVMRKVTPFTLNGKTVSFINVGGLSGNAQFPEVFTDCDKASSNDLKYANIFSAERELIFWLIGKGCL